MLALKQHHDSEQSPQMTIQHHSLLQLKGMSFLLRAWQSSFFEYAIKWESQNSVFVDCNDEFQIIMWQID